MQKKKTILIPAIFLFIIISLSNSYSQDERENIGNVITLHFQVGGALPAGDLSKRYGNFLTLGTGMDFITEKNNWLFGWKGDFHFGNSVKENVLGGLGGVDGFLFGNGLASADDFTLKQRGFYLGAHLGKIIPLSADNTRSGIRLTFGAGLLQHWIRLQQDPVNFLPQVDDEYGKGYDRLTNGLALRQFIGYQLLGKSKLVNFLIGFEFIEGFTQNRRSYNFDEMRQDTDKRVDLVLGLKVGWTLPFYVGESTGEIFY